MVLVAIIAAAAILMARRKQQPPMAAAKPPGAYPPPADSWSASGAALSSAPQSAHMVHSPFPSQGSYPVSVASGSAAPIAPLLPQGMPAGEVSPQMPTRI